jgi:hypothetical protein
VEAMSLRTMAAARQKDMKESATVVATTTFVAPEAGWDATDWLLPACQRTGGSQIRLRG